MPLYETISDVETMLYSPMVWDSHVTPEGDSYWSDGDHKIASHANPRQPVVANLINTAYEKVRNNIRDWDDVEFFFNTSQEALRRRLLVPWSITSLITRPVRSFGWKMSKLIS